MKTKTASITGRPAVMVNAISFIYENGTIKGNWIDNGIEKFLTKKVGNVKPHIFVAICRNLTSEIESAINN